MIIEDLIVYLSIALSIFSIFVSWKFCCIEKKLDELQKRLEKLLTND